MRYVALALLALPALAAAQEAPPGEATPPAQELAFADEDLRMSVPVSIAGAGPYRFIIDTGAQRTVISRQLASELNLPKGRDVRLIAMTGASNVGTVNVPELSVSTIGGTRIDEAPALDRRDMGAPGILGIDTLQGHAVVIDFDKGSMAVSPSRKRLRRSVPAMPNEIVIRAKNLFGQLVVTDAMYRGTKIRVILDTGSAVSMGNEPLRRKVFRRKKEQPIELTSVTGEKLLAGYTAVPQFRIGGVTVQNLPIAFSAAAPFKQFGLEDTPALLLGMDALRLFRRVHIDFANREVRLLLPRDTGPTPFDPFRRG